MTEPLLEPISEPRLEPIPEPSPQPQQKKSPEMQKEKEKMEEIKSAPPPTLPEESVPDMTMPPEYNIDGVMTTAFKELIKEGWWPTQPEYTSYTDGINDEDIDRYLENDDEDDEELAQWEMDLRSDEEEIPETEEPEDVEESEKENSGWRAPNPLTNYMY